MENSIINRYQSFQQKTEVKSDFDIKYMAIGLAGEVGEVLNEIKKLERDDHNILTTSRKEKLLAEMGDVMWYLAGLSNKCGFTLNDIILNNMEKLSKKNNGMAIALQIVNMPKTDRNRPR